ncbi:hypothetical protein BIY22_08915 [Vibrio panuliri]|uniref:Uncharacterized protein n=1 Tax=Vibrio panuliri TaxID=1381081 RepID=A0A1Q9HEW8_9VIBR|nr:hypothetical protein [Vibrio panuliri]OLQ88275.1 hypothetical protein BIY22_08915 [Vibrio panuliri]
MKFKLELGFAEVISFLALIVSCIALWLSFKSGEGLIIQGGGLVQTAVISDDQKNQCKFVLAVPVTFHNSGKKAVSLERIAPPEHSQSVMFASGHELEFTKSPKYKQYLSNSGIGVIPSMWLSQVSSMREFVPSHNYIGDLIRPNETYSFYRVLVIDSTDEVSQLIDPKVFLSLEIKFSNGQVEHVNNAIEIDLSANQKCS